MKKVGIITLFDSDNYGTCLQAYALQKTIIDLGYLTEIINYKHHFLSIAEHSLKDKVRTVLKEQGLLKLFEVIIGKKYINDSKAKFRSFRKHYLEISEREYRTIEDMCSLDGMFDAFVCGSDMIWAKESKRDLSIYFLQFVDLDKRIAYAPSFGRAEIPDAEIKRYQDGIMGIRFLTCREESGVDLIRKLTGRDAQLVVDPTLLLTAEQWKAIFPPTEEKEDYILCYMFGGIPNGFRGNLMYLKRQLGCKVKYIPGTLSEYMHERRAYGPAEYVKMYANAKFIVANSYHGLIFSLIFNKPFILLHREKKEYWVRYEDRMQSILNILNLEERYRDISQPIESKLIHLDYSTVNDQLKEWRELSRVYLKDALTEVIGIAQKV